MIGAGGHCCCGVFGAISLFALHEHAAIKVLITLAGRGLDVVSLPVFRLAAGQAVSLYSSADSLIFIARNSRSSARNSLSKWQPHRPWLQPSLPPCLHLKLHRLRQLRAMRRFPPLWPS